jgi:hypothetical protein
LSNKVLQALAIERIERLKLAFSSSKDVFWDAENARLLHPGEYGTFREKAVQELLQLFIPEQFGIDSGFVITNQGDISTQCDLIIFERSITPSIVTNAHKRFFPIEAVVAVGEVKSDVASMATLVDHLEKLARVKALREHIRNPSSRRSYRNRDYNPEKNPFDHIFSFLICNRFGFDPNSGQLEYSHQTASRFRHNLVLSITDGLFCYKAINGPPNYHYPSTGEKEHEIKWLRNDGSEIPTHFWMFLSSLYNALNVVTLLEPDMALYLSDDIFDG